MSKFAMFCATPVTWGAYLKLCVIAFGVSSVYAAIYWAYCKRLGYI